MLAANGDLAVWIARRDVELRGRVAHHFHYPLSAHTHVGSVDGTPCFFKKCEGFFVQKLNADVFENGHGAIVDRGDTFGAKRLCRVVVVDGNAPRHLVDHRRPSAACVPCAATAPFAWCITHDLASCSNPFHQAWQAHAAFAALSRQNVSFCAIT